MIVSSKRHKLIHDCWNFCRNANCIIVTGGEGEDDSNSLDPRRLLPSFFSHLTILSRWISWGHEHDRSIAHFRKIYPIVIQFLLFHDRIFRPSPTTSFPIRGDSSPFQLDVDSFPSGSYRWFRHWIHFEHRRPALPFQPFQPFHHGIFHRSRLQARTVSRAVYTIAALYLPSREFPIHRHILKPECSVVHDPSKRVTNKLFFARICPVEHLWNEYYETKKRRKEGKGIIISCRNISPLSSRDSLIGRIKINGIRANGIGIIKYRPSLT